MSTLGFTAKVWVPLAGIAILVVLLSVSFGGAVRLNAQSAVASTPDVTGDWVGRSWGGCSFANVWDPNGQPACGTLPAGLLMNVTVQEGGAFAGTFPPIPESKLTGAIGEDGTFLMQAWIGNNRIFFSGRFHSTRNVLEMRGLANEFEDWRATAPSMGSTYFTFRKLH